MATVFNIRHLEPNLNEYSNTVLNPGGGTAELAVNLAAALAGSRYGLAVTTTGGGAAFGQVAFDAVSRLRTRLYFDINSTNMADGDEFVLLKAGGNVFRIEINFDAKEGYRARLIVRDDAGSSTVGDFFTFSDEPHFVEVDWKHATAVGADDGFALILLDGKPKQLLANLDNGSLTIAELRIGAVQPVSNGVEGTFYVDEVRGNDDGGAIGPHTEGIQCRIFFSTRWHGKIDPSADLSADEQELQVQINDWLLQHPNIEIVDIVQSEAASSSSGGRNESTVKITIFYRRAAEAVPPAG